MKIRVKDKLVEFQEILKIYEKRIDKDRVIRLSVVEWDGKRYLEKRVWDKGNPEECLGLKREDIWEIVFERGEEIYELFNLEEIYLEKKKEVDVR